mgnify:CR=1 FL=1
MILCIVLRMPSFCFTTAVVSTPFLHNPSCYDVILNYTKYHEKLLPHINPSPSYDCRIYYNSYSQIAFLVPYIQFNYRYIHQNALLFPYNVHLQLVYLVISVVLTGRKCCQNGQNFNIAGGEKIALTDSGFSGGKFYELNCILTVQLAAGIFLFIFFCKLFLLEQ